MKSKVTSYKKFTDSYIMFYHRTPRFLYAIIIILLCFIIGLITWSAFVFKPDVVQATGQFTVNEKYYVMPQISGKIAVIYISDGEQVSKDDILFEYDTSDIDLKISQTEGLIKNLNKRIDFFEKLITAIRTDVEENIYNSEAFDELEFYNYLETYLTDKLYYEKPEDLAKFKTQTINSFLAERSKLYQQFEDYEYQLLNYTQMKEQYTIKAVSSGTIVLNSAISIGRFVNAGENIGTIINSADELIMESYINAAQRTKINLGDKVQIALLGVSQNEYGTSKGNITSISPDAIATEDGSFYVVKIKLHTNKLVDSSGNALEFVMGGQAEIRIIYDETTYLKYFLEQLGIKIK